MSSKIQYIPLEAAYDRMFSLIQTSPRVETIPTYQGYRRVLAEDIVSEVDCPPRDTAHFDGYAVRSQDTQLASPNSPVSLKVRAVLKLGDIPSFRLEKGEATAVPTGGPLPDGADATIMKEHARLGADSKLWIDKPVKQGENVIPNGLDVKRGSTILPSGTTLRAQDLGLLALIRKAEIRVTARPRIGVLSTGTELVENIENWEPGKTVASHTKVLAKVLEELGAVPIELGIAPDNKETIRATILRAIRDCDMLLTIGGSSVGSEDYVAETINASGKPGIIFQGIQVHPGRLGGVGLVNNKPVVMLPGLVQGTLVVFYALAFPIIKKLMGIGRSKKEVFMEGVPFVHANMVREVKNYFYFEKFKSFKKVLFVKLRKIEQNLEAEPLLGDTSLISIVTGADGWAVIPEGKTEISKGEQLQVYFPPGLSNFLRAA